MARRLTAMLGAVLLVLWLAACGDPSNNTESKNTPPAFLPEETFTDMNGKAVPAYRDVDISSMVPELFKTDENGRVYYEDASVALYTGVDVSYVQGDVDWAAVKADGIDFAMLRVGGRGWGTGDIYPDKYFEQNYSGAKQAGLKVGVYFYSQAVSVPEAEEEARYVLSVIQDLEISFPVAYDWELPSDSGARTQDTDAETVTECAIAFCSAVEAAGYRTMIYFNWTQGYYTYHLPSVRQHDFWLAEYQNHPSFLYDYKIWQYTDQGHVAGIENEVDLNVALADHYNS